MLNTIKQASEDDLTFSKTTQSSKIVTELKYLKMVEAWILIKAYM